MKKIPLAVANCFSSLGLRHGKGKERPGKQQLKDVCARSRLVCIACLRLVFKFPSTGIAPSQLCPSLPSVNEATIQGTRLCFLSSIVYLQRTRSAQKEKRKTKKTKQNKKNLASSPDHSLKVTDYRTKTGFCAHENRCPHENRHTRKRLVSLRHSI